MRKCKRPFANEILARVVAHLGNLHSPHRLVVQTHARDLDVSPPRTRVARRAARRVIGRGVDRSGRFGCLRRARDGGVLHHVRAFERYRRRRFFLNSTVRETTTSRRGLPRASRRRARRCIRLARAETTKRGKRRVYEELESSELQCETSLSVGDAPFVRRRLDYSSSYTPPTRLSPRRRPFLRLARGTEQQTYTMMKSLTP